MKILKFLHSFDKGINETVDKWFLMSSMVNVLLILFVYFMFIFKIGLWFMAKRRPFKLKKILLVYNLFQIIFCSAMIVKALRTSRLMDLLIEPDCKVERSPDEYLAHLSQGWVYMMFKAIDLLDTVFFVLRKKYNQVTFLHVYHHSIMFFAAWYFLKFSPETELALIGILNSFVHAIMYLYYLMAAMGPRYKKYLWWKKYMTTIQMLQFVVILAYFIAMLLKGCKLSKTTTFATVLNATIFLYLFFDFYRKTYSSNSKKNVL